MKIKTDFVTNSSSASFIVFIPESYNPTLEQITQLNKYKEYIEREDPTKNEINNVIDELNTYIKFLKDGKEVMVGPYGWEALILFDILKKDDLILKKIDVDGEGATTVSPITFNELKKLIAKVNENKNRFCNQ